MNKTAWDDKYLLGIQAIDQQHRQLFELIAELDGLVAVHAGTKEIQGVLLRFQRWAEMHFASEETLLSITDYPGHEAHIAEHKNFLKTFEKNIRLIASRPIAVTETRISLLLTHWLQTHILKNDQEYVPHLKTKIRNLA